MRNITYAKASLCNDAKNVTSSTKSTGENITKLAFKHGKKNLENLDDWDIILVHEGVPQAKKRPRFSPAGKFVKVYDTQTRDKRQAKFQLSSQMRDKGYLKLADGPIMAKMVFYRPETKIDAQRSFKRGVDPETIFHWKKPDLDNMIKFVLDILNGLAYHDDSQIAVIHSEKRYSTRPRAEIFLKQGGAT